MVKYSKGRAYEWGVLPYSPSSPTSISYGALTRNIIVQEDEGCWHNGVEVSDSCLTCPLSQCKHDEGDGASHFIEANRWVERVKMGRVERGEMSETEWVREVARVEGVSERTVWRRLKRNA